MVFLSVHLFLVQSKNICTHLSVNEVYCIFKWSAEGLLPELRISNRSQRNSHHQLRVTESHRPVSDGKWREELKRCCCSGSVWRGWWVTVWCHVTEVEDGYFGYVSELWEEVWWFSEDVPSLYCSIVCLVSFKHYFESLKVYLFRTITIIITIII